MAAMSTVLTEYSSNGNSKTYSISGHTISKPKLVLAKRKVPTGNQTVSEVELDVVYATEDSDGAILASKIVGSVTVRFPIDGDTTDRDAMVVVLRDAVASDEFTALVASGTFPPG
jgi:hypothetical protein